MSTFCVDLFLQYSENTCCCSSLVQFATTETLLFANNCERSSSRTAELVSFAAVNLAKNCVVHPLEANDEHAAFHGMYSALTLHRNKPLCVLIVADFRCILL